MYAAVLIPAEDMGSPSPCEFYPYLPDTEDLASITGQDTPPGLYPECVACTLPLDESMDTGDNPYGIVVVWFPDTAPQRGAFDCAMHARCVWDTVAQGDYLALTIVPTMADAFLACRGFNGEHAA